MSAAIEQSPLGRSGGIETDTLPGDSRLAARMTLRGQSSGPLLAPRSAATRRREPSKVVSYGGDYELAGAAAQGSAGLTFALTSHLSIVGEIAATFGYIDVHPKGEPDLSFSIRNPAIRALRSRVSVLSTGSRQLVSIEQTRDKGAKGRLKMATVRIVKIQAGDRR